MIETNRVARLLHRAKFLLRQRRALRFFRRYVVSAEDIRNAATEKEKKKVKDGQTSAAVNASVQLNDLLDGFDPENDAFDRRIFFEVTGQSLIPDEFLRDDSSGGSAELDDGQLEDPIDWLLAKKVEEDSQEQESNYDQQHLLTQRSIN